MPGPLVDPGDIAMSRTHKNPPLRGFPGGSDGNKSACNVGYLGLIRGSGRSPREGNSYPLQYSGLEKSMDCTVHGVAKSWTQLSDFHFNFLFDAGAEDGFPSGSDSKEFAWNAGDPC